MNPLEQYISDHIDPEPPELQEIQREVNLRLLYPRMCSGHLQGTLLTMLTTMIAPRNVLEIGTYAGYSALCIARGLPPGGHLDTVEIDDEMESFIRRQWSRMPQLADRITLHIGDADTVVPDLGKVYDLVYMDGNKRTYAETFLKILPMVRPGGFIIADNTLWDGKVTDPSARDAQTEGIRRFNDLVADTSGLRRVILPLRDGLTLIQVGVAYD